MATDVKQGSSVDRRDRGRVVYRLTGAQALKIPELGIIGADEDVERWDGVLYKMTKYEPHNSTVMNSAELLRPLLPPDYHLREEKSSRERTHYLPEPDVSIARGSTRSYAQTLPPLERFALVIEVRESTHDADYKQKPPVYARAGIPVYWVIDPRSREIVVFGEPRSLGQGHGDSTRARYASGQSLDVVIDGEARGRLAVDDVLPPPPPAQEAR
jgi:Uma2 family endonuclease